MSLLGASVALWLVAVSRQRVRVDRSRSSSVPTSKRAKEPVTATYIFYARMELSATGRADRGDEFRVAHGSPSAPGS